MPISRSALSILLVVAACSSSDRAVKTPDTVAAAPAAAPSSTAIALCASPSGRDSLCFRAQRTYDFARDGHPFTVMVDAHGPAADSMQVALRIVRGDTIYHRADWSTVMYGRYDARPVARDSVRRRVDAQLARLLADSAFRPTSAFLGSASNRDRVLRETVAFDVGVDGERRSRGLTSADTLPTAAAQSPKPVSDTLRTRALVDELRDAPAFRYFAGGEATYAVAWSAKEQRFVVVYSCC